MCIGDGCQGLEHKAYRLIRHVFTGTEHMSFQRRDRGTVEWWKCTVKGKTGDRPGSRRQSAGTWSRGPG